MAAGRGAVARTVIDEVHIEVARVFVALPESNGYAVGGGVAALAHHIVERTTDDLDLFADRRRVQARPLAAAEALETAAHDRNWGIDWIRRYPDYARLLGTPITLRCWSTWPSRPPNSRPRSPSWGPPSLSRKSPSAS